MVLVRRRYYIWLFRAYVKKWKKTIFTSLLLGASAFFLFFLFLTYYVFPLFNNSIDKIGYAGSYTLATLPSDILDNVSYGLTKVSPDGTIQPAAAASWKVSQNGKVYTFTLKPDLKLSNGKHFDLKDLPYKFKDVKIEITDPTHVRFTIKTPYAPFLATVSSPILVKNYGFNSYHISKIEQNSGFIKSLTLTSDNRKKIFYFYPTQDALTTAFMLGEVNSMVHVLSQTSPEKDFSTWKNVQVIKTVDYSSLVSVFFNTSDPVLSNKKVRQALVYALPQKFPEGERSFSFIEPHSIYYSKSPNEGLLDLELAKSLLDSSDSKDITISLQVPDELVPVAQEIATSWKRVGVKTKIITTSDLPSTYQALLYTMKVPRDPDTYTIWHSAQVNNITHYKNVRIDKLLEDGRQTIDKEKRIQIYSDVQKYLLDDAPAAFLYFPYSYTVTR